MSILPVFIVNDDEDDHQFIEEVWKELGIKNELKFFSDGEQLLKTLKGGAIPFIVISDVNLPKINGFELRQRLLDDDDMKSKSIPFIFWSQQVSKSQVAKAYDLAVHGFFVKESEFNEIKETFKRIIQYWLKSILPEQLSPLKE